MDPLQDLMDETHYYSKEQLHVGSVARSMIESQAVQLWCETERYARHSKRVYRLVRYQTEVLVSNMMPEDRVSVDYMVGILGDADHGKWFQELWDYEVWRKNSA